MPAGLTMRASLLQFLALCALPAVLIAQTGAPTLPRTQIQSDQLQWTGTGIQTAAVVGNPASPGVYVTRLRFPKGARIMPHMHPDERVAVLLSGSLYFSYGETFDDKALTRLAAGATWTEPPNTPHFALAKDEDAVVQVVGIGPSRTIPVK
jgi:quercetin dioxygenase-like cupin family protein